MKPTLRCRIFGHKWQYENSSTRICARCCSCQKLDRKYEGGGVTRITWVRDVEAEEVRRLINDFGK